MSSVQANEWPEDNRQRRNCDFAGCNTKPKRYTAAGLTGHRRMAHGISLAGRFALSGDETIDLGQIAGTGPSEKSRGPAESTAASLEPTSAGLPPDLLEIAQASGIEDSWRTVAGTIVAETASGFHSGDDEFGSAWGSVETFMSGVMRVLEPESPPQAKPNAESASEPVDMGQIREDAAYAGQVQFLREVTRVQEWAGLQREGADLFAAVKEFRAAGSPATGKRSDVHIRTG